jgi:hypothetical protein
MGLACALASGPRGATSARARAGRPGAAGARSDALSTCTPWSEVTKKYVEFASCKSSSASATASMASSTLSSAFHLLRKSISIARTSCLSSGP